MTSVKNTLKLGKNLKVYFTLITRSDVKLIIPKRL